MRKKIFILCIIGMFLLTGISSASELYMTDRNFENENYDQVDQTQTQFTDAVPLIDGIYWAQSFKPTVTKLTKVDLLINRDSGNYVSSLVVYICEDLDPFTPRTSIQKNNLHTQIHPNNEWHEFDFDDIYVTPEKTYYIVLYGFGGLNQNHYQWFYSSNNPYSRGCEWHNAYPPLNEGWVLFSENSDFCFRTYGDNSDQPPVTEIQGPSTVLLGERIDYYVSATDPEGNFVCLQIDWGDEVSDWTNVYASGSWNTFYHTWYQKGTFTIKARAKDYYTGNIGPWSNTITVDVQKSRSRHAPFNFLKQFNPFLYQLIQVFLKV